MKQKILGLDFQEDVYYDKMKNNIQRDCKITAEDTDGIALSIYKSRGLLRQYMDTKAVLLDYVMTKLPAFLTRRCKARKSMGKIVKNGAKRIFYELDVVNMMRTVRLSKLLFKTQLTQQQRILL